MMKLTKQQITKYGKLINFTNNVYFDEKLWL